MSANIRNDGTVRQLDRAAEGDERIIESDVTDASRLVRLLNRILKELQTLRRRWWPHRIDFEDVTVDATGTTQVPLQHNLNGRVRWWVVDWIADSTGTRPNLWRDATTTSASTLVLLSGAAGVATIRCEEAG